MMEVQPSWETDIVIVHYENKKSLLVPASTRGLNWLTKNVKKCNTAQKYSKLLPHVFRASKAGLEIGVMGCTFEDAQNGEPTTFVSFDPEEEK